MATINLLTRHFNDNCGTVFQTYATCKILEQLGHKVTLINLQDRDFSKYFQSKQAYILLPSFLRFWYFRKKYFPKMTQRNSEIDKIKLPDAEYLIVGSDQVWNKDITNNLSLYYFLNFAKQNQKRISLSSSFGKEKWSESSDYTDIVKGELSKFTSISVREISGVTICNEVFSLTARHLIDPTIAFGDYANLIKNAKLKNEICCFTFKPHGYFFKVAEYISKKEGIPIRDLGANYSLKYKTGFRYKQGPIQWLRYIASSKIFMADSFHGIAFSIILNKQFIALCADPDKFDRIRSLLKMFDLEDKIVMSVEDLMANYERILQKIDYHKVNELVRQKQLEFINYLNEYISGDSK